MEVRPKGYLIIGQILGQCMTCDEDPTCLRLLVPLDWTGLEDFVDHVRSELVHLATYKYIGLFLFSLWKT